MGFPFNDSNLRNWEPYETTGGWTRPLSGAELVLDQIQFHNNGQNTLICGVLFSSTFTQDEIRTRFMESWIRLHFYSPLVAASIVRDLHFQGFGSWIYNPVTYEGAQDWAAKTLFFHSEVLTDDTSINEFMQHKLLETIPYEGSGVDSSFFGHILMQQGGKFVLIIHTTHSHLDGPAVFDCLNVLLDWAVSQDKHTHVSQLAWGEEYKNLVPDPLTLFGGAKDGWEQEGVQDMNELNELFTDVKHAHGLVPSRQEAQVLGWTHFVLRTLPEDLSSRILQKVKSMKSTVTVAFEAAHILASHSMGKPDPNIPWEQATSFMCPAIVALRQHIAPPWNKPTTLVGTGGCIVLSVPHSIIPAPPATIPQQMSVIMAHFKEQYNKWTKDKIKHFPLLEIARCTPSVARGYPTQSFAGDPDAEITNLGIVDQKLKMVYRDEDKDEGLLQVEDFYVRLRRTTPILMTHVMTINGKIRVQCQGADVWDKEFIEKFMDTLLENIKLLAEEPIP